MEHLHKIIEATAGRALNALRAPGRGLFNILIGKPSLTTTISLGALRCLHSTAVAS